MKPFIICVAFAMAMFKTALADSGGPPRLPFPKNFFSVLKKKKELFEKSSVKVCACNIMRVGSQNERANYIAVLAEATSKTEGSARYAPANFVLRKEAKRLKGFFYSDIEIEERLNEDTECRKVYKNLKFKYKNIRLYDIMDVDALTHKWVVKR